MRKIAIVVVLAVLSFTACKTESFKKGEQGLEYKIISGKGGGKQVQYGDYMHMQIGQYYQAGEKDSLLNDSRTQGPVIELLDSVNTPSQYFHILKLLKKGDSLVIRILTDSAFKNNIENMPPFLKKGKYLTTTVKLLNVYGTKEQADSARSSEMAATMERMKKENEEQLKKDDATIKEHLSKNNIQAVKGDLGTYVQIIQSGTGPNVDTPAVVKVNYTGRLLNGTKSFDSNIDPAFNHVQPLLVNMTNEQGLGTPVIPGWMDGIKKLNKGAKAKLFIPSSLGYASQDKGEDIPPYSILEFDIEILDIYTPNQARPIVEAEQKIAMEMQRKFMDSMSKANPQMQQPGN